MPELLAVTYLWLKAGHIIFVIFWMAGLFMLPRFFVYHQETTPGSLEEAAWVSRQAKLLKIILWPSMLAVWAFGLALAVDIGAMTQGWFHAKLGLVLALSVYHLGLAYYSALLARGERRWSGKRLRLLNEVPGVAAALIVVLVVVKPF